MSFATCRRLRVLAIHVTRRSFGFIVLELPLTLVDWGVRSVRYPISGLLVPKLRSLFDLYRPDVVVTEELECDRIRRSKRVVRMLSTTRKAVSRHGIQLQAISPKRLLTTFRTFGASNKHEIAQVVANHLPDLAVHLPRKRKPWMTEDHRMGFFVAASLALTFAYGTVPRV